MRTFPIIMALGAVLAVTVACGGGTSSGDKTKTAEAGKPPATVAASPAAAASAVATVANTKPAGTAAAGTAIKVAAKDFSLTLDKASGPAGSFTFTATNTGPADHEFVVFKTDLAADKMPLVADQSKVNEDADGVHHIDEIEDLNVGDTKTLTVDLEPGKYVFLCNLPAHYTQGMYIAFAVQ